MDLFFPFFQTPLQRSKTSETCRLKNYFGDQFSESDLFCSASVLCSNEQYLFICRPIFTAIVTPCKGATDAVHVGLLAVAN